MSDLMVSEKDKLSMGMWTDDQKELIKKTVAKNATDDELELFIHNCTRLGLDPFAKQIHFVKYGDRPGNIIVGIDGFRLIASRTGHHSGTERGVTRDDNGKVVSAWAKVYRDDWGHPASEEVPFDEYDTGKASWVKMPATMIKKVAEAAALRMAFPAELSGVYSAEEMNQSTDSFKKNTKGNFSWKKPKESLDYDAKADFYATQGEEFKEHLVSRDDQVAGLTGEQKDFLKNLMRQIGVAESEFGTYLKTLMDKDPKEFRQNEFANICLRLDERSGLSPT